MIKRVINIFGICLLLTCSIGWLMAYREVTSKATELSTLQAQSNKNLAIHNNISRTNISRIEDLESELRNSQYENKELIDRCKVSTSKIETVSDENAVLNRTIKQSRSYQAILEVQRSDLADNVSKLTLDLNDLTIAYLQDSDFLQGLYLDEVAAKNAAKNDAATAKLLAEQTDKEANNLRISLNKPITIQAWEHPDFTGHSIRFVITPCNPSFQSRDIEALPSEQDANWRFSDEEHEVIRSISAR